MVEQIKMLVITKEEVVGILKRKFNVEIEKVVMSPVGIKIYVR